MKKKLVIAILIGIVNLNVMAISANESEKSVNEMTYDELKEAYTSLQKDYEELKNKFDAEEENKVQIDKDSVHMDSEEFLKDIVDSYNDRSVVANKYTNAEINSMTYEEAVEYRESCAHSEDTFYEKYSNASFDDLNIQYLCLQYIKGLEKQYNAQNVWNETDDYNKFLTEYQSGYYNRAYVIVELSDYWNLAFGDVESMRNDTAYMDSFNEAETRNSAVDSSVSQKTQQLLNDIGFYCGAADGIPGKRTVKSIKRFQEMYGYEPADGMIDEELISQLETELDKKPKNAEISEAETE